MNKMKARLATLPAVLMLSNVIYGQTDTIAADTALWFNQTQQLDEVVVKSRLPKTRVKGDTMRTTVAGTVLEKAGTASDALAKIPSLEAERDGGVKVTGRGNAEVYINGRRVQDASELSRLRSDQIQHVDVVQNPGARYAASTKAVVRITLKKAQGEGFSFRDCVDAMYQYGHTLTNNLDVNYRTGGLDVTASFWAGRYGHAKSLQEHELSYYAGPDKYMSYTSQKSQSVWKGFSPQLQVNYMMDEHHSFGAFYKYDRHPSSDFHSTFYTDNYQNGHHTEHSESRIWQDESFSKHIFNAYYSGKAGRLDIDFNIDALFDDTRTPGTTHESATDAAGQKPVRAIGSNTLSADNFWAAKLILSYPVWKGTLSLGGEHTYNHRTDAYDFKATNDVPVKATDTEIDERASAAFIEYGRPFGKVFAQVGLRYEHLTNDYFNFGKREEEVCRNYGDWFPTAMVSVPIGKLQFALSYRRDIERPHYSSLTSSTIYINRYTYQSGNPYMLPTYTHSLVLNAAYQAAGLTVSYSRIKDSATMSTEPFPGSDDPLVSLVHPVNSSNDYNQLSINPYYCPTVRFPLSGVSCTWNPMWSVHAVFQDYKTITADGSIKTLSRPYVQCVWNNDFELPEDWRLTASFSWNPKGDFQNYHINSSQFHADMAIQHDVNLHSLGKLTLDARCIDMFNTNQTDAVIYGYRELTTANPARRTFILSLAWKFNEARSKYRGSGAGDRQKARM